MESRAVSSFGYYGEASEMIAIWGLAYFSV